MLLVYIEVSLNSAISNVGIYQVSMKSFPGVRWNFAKTYSGKQTGHMLKLVSNVKIKNKNFSQKL